MYQTSHRCLTRGPASNSVHKVVPPPHPRLRRKTVTVAAAFVAALAALSALATVPLAGADQLANDRAEAQVLAQKIYALGLREGALGEQYDAGVLSLQKAANRVLADKRRWTAAQANQQKTVNVLRQAAVDAYVGGGTQMQLSNTAPMPNANDALLRQELEQTFATNQSDALDRYRLAAAELATTYTQLVKDRDTRAAQVDALARERDQVQAAEFKLQALQAQVKGNIAVLVAQIERQQQLAQQRAEEALLARERAQAEAAARVEAQREAAARAQAEAAAKLAAAREAAAVLATTTTAPTATTIPLTAATTVPLTPVTTTPAAQSGAVLPGENPNAPGAIAAAESVVGDPYVWGAAGPGAFDCSGLVQWSWAQVGVYLPHYSGAQYDLTIHIPMSQLQPGDLVFPADPGEHVAMYIGNGEIIEAPYTGAYVHIIPLTSFFVLASRIGS